MSYEYKNPLERGYKKVKLSKKYHNKLFKGRQIKWSDKYDYYLKENNFIMHKTKNSLYIGLATILLPFICLLSLIECFDILKEYRSLFNQKKLGKHSSDGIGKNTDLLQKVKKYIR